MIESRTCLLPMITAESHQMIRLRGHYLRGVLPVAGGLLDQPARFVRAMEVMDEQEASA